MREEIIEAFGSLDEIESDELRTKVVDVWESALEANDYDSIHELEWWPPFIADTGNQSQVPHVQDVTRCAIAITDSLTSTQPKLEVDRDLVVAGALLHDVSKTYEIDGEDTSELHEWLPHPHYAIHLLAKEGLSLHLQHIVFTHSEASGVDPRSMEARIVQVADEIACDGIFWSEANELWNDLSREYKMTTEDVP